MPAALIVGAFGQDNPGDEALLAASIDAVRLRPGWEPVVATNRPEEAAAIHDVAAIEASPTTTATAAVRTDALVVGGGTVFKELHPATGRAPGALLRRATALAGIFHARRRPVALLGVGAAPIEGLANQRLARALAHRADLLVLRDDDSAGVLAAMGVQTPLRVGADLAWMTCDAPAEVPPPERQACDGPLGVAVSHLAGDDDFIGRLGQALREVAADGTPIELEPWQGSPRLGADARLARHLQAEIGPAASVVAPPEDLADATDRMTGRCAAVAMRFHATVAAAEAGTPFVAVTHEPKLAALARRTDQPTIDLEDPVAAMTSSIEQAVGGEPPSDDAVRREHRRARAMVDLLGLVLTGESEATTLLDLDLVPDPVPA